MVTHAAIAVILKDIPFEGKAKVLLLGGIFCVFEGVVYNTWTKRVGNLDYEFIHFSAKVRYNYVTETDRAREGAGAAAGRTLKIEYAASGTSR